jgi:hypothetical protein
MPPRFDRATRALCVGLGILTLLGAGLLLISDAFPERFPLNAHDFLGAFPLATIAVAYLIYQSAQRPPFREWAKAVLLAAAFLFWAANQLWPNLRQAVLFNDIAIGLFVFDVFLVTIRPPAASRDEAMPERLLNKEIW